MDGMFGIKNVLRCKVMAEKINAVYAKRRAGHLQSRAL
jgi:hypothetical protein